MDSQLEKLEKNKALHVAIYILVIAVFAPFFYMYFQFQQTQEDTYHNTPAQKKYVDKVIKIVNHRINISDQERPLHIKIVEESQKNHPFLKDAELGDDLLLYTTSRRAVLYRPSEKEIIKNSILLTSQEAQNISSISAQ